MKRNLLILLCCPAFAATGRAQIHSFESPQAAAWSADGARLRCGGRERVLDLAPGEVRTLRFR